MNSLEPSIVGKVYLVGGGPGDPGLITLRGCECLARADVVLYDYLVNPQILQHAAPHAEQISLGRHGRETILPQAEINRRMVELARSGKIVCRLKGGDPAVFARAADEVEALEHAGIPYEIVPGLTAALAIGSYTGIPLTHADSASAVALVAGHERDAKPASSLDYGALAAFPGTLVFYMGVTTVHQWSGQLLAHGKPADTPAAVVRRCGWPDQRIYRCTLGTLAEVVEREHLRPPALMVIGDVVALATAPSWFDRLPLHGACVLVTRPADGRDPLAAELAELGAKVLVQPAIEIAPPADWRPVDAALRRIEEFGWLVFSSANGVRSLLDRIEREHGDVRVLGRTRLAAIGPGTAAALADYHLKADLVPPEFRAESLADALAPLAAGQKVLLARASRGREVLAERLGAAGAQVEQVVVYQSRDVAAADPEILEALQAGKIDWVTVTSSAIARSLVAMYGDTLRHSRLASISPVTSETLAALGFAAAAEAKTYTIGGLAAALCRARAKSLSESL